MSQPVKPDHTVVGPPPAASPGTVSSQDDHTNSGAIVDDDGINIAHLFAPPEGEGELGRLGHFRVMKKLGAGGMGMVLLAEDINLLRPVALKIMLPKYAKSTQARERFLREARVAARIQHDHIVTIHHVGEDRNIPFIAMEFLKGASLDDYFEKKKAMSLSQSMRIGREIAKGLQAAHSLGLVHRDIKPANIWLESPKGRVKILDFGLARDADDEAKITHSGAIIGTPAYMSPEQASGRTVDQRTDLFSLGIVLFELVTGRLPFSGTSTMAVMHALTYDPHPSIAILNPKAPAGLIKLIDQLLEKKVEDRPGSAGDVVKSIVDLERPAQRLDGVLIPDFIDLPFATSVVRESKEGGDLGLKQRTPDKLEAKSKRKNVPRTRRQAASRKLPVPFASVLPDSEVTDREIVPGSTAPDPRRSRLPALIAIAFVSTLLAVAMWPRGKPVASTPESPSIAGGAETSFDLGNGVKLEMIAINAKGKSFLMGSPKDEPLREESSSATEPEEQHGVTFAHSFAMGKYEVTQEQYEAVMGRTPRNSKGRGTLLAICRGTTHRSSSES